MSAIFLLIPLGLLMLAVAIWAFIWAVQKRQFQDLDSAGHSILMEEKFAGSEFSRSPKGTSHGGEVQKFAGSEISRQPQKELKLGRSEQKPPQPNESDSNHHD